MAQLNDLIVTGDAKINGDLMHNSGMVAYGTCTTAAATAAKVVTVDDPAWTLKVGNILGVRYTNTNTASSCTISVNNTGAKQIYYAGGVNTSNSVQIAGAANRTLYYMYDGTYWVWISGGYDANDNAMPAAISWTAAATAAKAASQNYYVANKGYTLVTFQYANTAASALTLNINNQGAKPIYINGSASSASNYTIPAGCYIVYYNGTNYYLRTDGLIQGGLAGNISGSATSLATARTINDTSFNGTANIRTATSYNLALNSTTTTNNYAIFARMSSSNSTGNGEGTFLVSGLGNYGGSCTGTWLVHVSNRGSKPTMTVTTIQPNNSGTVTFGYYTDSTNGYFYFGVYTTQYRAGGFITVLRKTDVTVQAFSDSTTAPTGWTAVTPRVLQDQNNSSSEGSGSGTPVGSGMDYFGTTAPENYMFANGAAISRTEYAELFAVIGTTYGAGDGSTTFNLPDKRSRVSVMLNSSDSNFNTLGKKVGAATHTHSYGLQFGAYWREVLMESNSKAGLLNYGSDNNWTLKTFADCATSNNVQYNSGTTGSTNQASCAHQRAIANTSYSSSIQPSFVCNYIIKVKSDAGSAAAIISEALEGSY